MEEKATDNNSGILENAANLGKKILDRETPRKFVAWYIDTSEKIANDVLDYQASATEWAKETALAPIFEAQYDLGKKFVKRSAEVARTIWRVDK